MSCKSFGLDRAKDWPTIFGDVVYLVAWKASSLIYGITLLSERIYKCLGMYGGCLCVFASSEQSSSGKVFVAFGFFVLMRLALGNRPAIRPSLLVPGYVLVHTNIAGSSAKVIVVTSCKSLEILKLWAVFAGRLDIRLCTVAFFFWIAPMWFIQGCIRFVYFYLLYLHDWWSTS